MVLVAFIDKVGGTLLFPFFSLYITEKFGVGMTQAGIILGLFSIAGLFGGMAGGALTDRFGRRKLILFGLVFSALSTLSIGFVNEFAALYPLAIFTGLLTDVAGPAHMAMIADILPENKRQEGFGILRVVGNMAWLIGPTIGGFIANRSYLALFILDAVVSCCVAGLFYRLIPETRPQGHPGQPSESTLETFRGYGRVMRDSPYMAFLIACILMGLVYQQLYNSLSVFLRDEHGIAPQGYGFLLTVSAIVVILLQLWVSRILKRRPPFKMMVIGTLFYALGFGLFGVVSAYTLFALAVVIITLGEMIIMPTTQVLAANFAPEAMRGRYMAVYGLTWMLPSTIGPGAAGIILDHFNPNLLWYGGAVLCVVSALGFFALHLRLGAQPRFAPALVEEETAPA